MTVAQKVSKSNPLKIPIIFLAAIFFLKECFQAGKSIIVGNSVEADESQQGINITHDLDKLFKCNITLNTDISIPEVEELDLVSNTKLREKICSANLEMNNKFMVDPKSYTSDVFTTTLEHKNKTSEYKLQKEFTQFKIINRCLAEMKYKFFSKLFGADNVKLVQEEIKVTPKETNISAETTTPNSAINDLTPKLNIIRREFYVLLSSSGKDYKLPNENAFHNKIDATTFNIPSLEANSNINYIKSGSLWYPIKR